MAHKTPRTIFTILLALGAGTMARAASAQSAEAFKTMADPQFLAQAEKQV